MAEYTFLPEAENNKIGYCLDVILREAKKEDVLVKQLFYTKLSMYSNDPRNLAIQSPSGEGKNYIIRKVADIFPKEDVIKYVGMTEKSIFHRKGKLVIKNDDGNYEFIDETLEKLDEDIEAKEEELFKTNDINVKQGLKSQIKEIEKEKKRLYKDAMKLIDLSHKCIIFLDTPKQELLNAIMSLLSHDAYEVEYEFVDTNNGIKTKTNVLRGWPVVIFAQAIDTSNYQRWPEIQRRFIITNPRMDEEKYRAAIQLIVHRHSVPDFLYQKTVVSDEQKEQAREIVKSFKEKILDISTATQPGTNNVFIPFEEAIIESLAPITTVPKTAKKSSDMTIADRIVGYLTLLAQVNIENRPYIIYRKKGESTTQRIPLATFDDLKEALFLMPYSNGIRPYVLEWYYDVFVKTYDEKYDANKGQPDWKPISSGSDNTISESRFAVTGHELADATLKIKGKRLSSKQVRKTYLDPLINQGYIDTVTSQLDRRADIYFPIITRNEKEQENRVISVSRPIFPSKTYIRNKILALLENRFEDTILEINGNYDIDNLIDKYYNNPEDIFKEIVIEEESTTKEEEENKDKKNKNSIAENLFPNGANNKPSPSNVEEKYGDSPNRTYSLPLSDSNEAINQYDCYYCQGFSTNDKHEYEKHVIMTHPKCQCYPSKADIERLGLTPQGRSWEV